MNSKYSYWLWLLLAIECSGKYLYWLVAAATAADIVVVEAVGEADAVVAVGVVMKESERREVATCSQAEREVER